ncbi:glycosyltransferase family 4 protein [Massilia sp. DWR3-1-1]|uniref:glycosyltransferase family 4 protein n=1 Tax=Massilia sp. DWR3-1-1 TaxID=2804559 RepID=UPI003CE698C0
MKIAVDYSWLGPTGIGRMAAEVISRAPPEIDILGIREGCQNARPYTPIGLALAIRTSDADAFWSPGFMPPAATFRTPSAITIHDLTHLHFYGTKHRFYYNHVILPLLRKVDLIFTVSDYTKLELQDWSGIPDDRIVRIYNGVDPSFSPDGPAIDIGRPYILYAGNRRGYKNVDNLMAAFARSGLASDGFMLGLTGKRDAASEAVERSLDIVGHVHYFGFVADAMMPDLYRGAHATAFVSHYEGFGLPIVESMACGVPVITSLNSSMPEVAGDAAILVDSHSIDDIADGLARVCRNISLRAALQASGLARAACFSWDSTGKDYWNELRALKMRR